MGVFMEPSIWGGLPDDLLHEVCARLPVPQICQLRLLSKDWKRAIDTRSGYFRHYLEEKVYPNMFGLISPELHQGGFWGPYSARVFDVKSDRWHDLVMDSLVTRGMSIVGAADGGLICLVNERTDETPLLITVLNPLTRKSVKLPCLLGIVDRVRRSDKPMMIQICMDSERQHYNVLVVGYTPSPQVYSSKNKGWTIVGADQQSWDRICGIDFRWQLRYPYNPSLRYYKPSYIGYHRCACAYDFGDGRLKDIFGRSGNGGWLSLAFGFAASRKRLFGLHLQHRHGGAANLVPADDRDWRLGLVYCILEYHLEKNTMQVVRGETHNCSPFDEFSLDEASFHKIHACNGFLLHFTVDMETGDWRQGWLYDLSSHEWRKMAEARDHMHRGIRRMRFMESLMCELRWDAVP